MNKIILCLGTVLFNSLANAQTVNWEKALNWQLYNIRHHEAFSYSIDTLKNFKSVALESNKMNFFLHSVRKLPDDTRLAWMGLFVATCQLEDGSIRKLAISTYGGFFYDEKLKTYYELPLSLRKIGDPF